MSRFLMRLKRKRRTCVARNARWVGFWAAGALLVFTLPLAPASWPLILAIMGPVIIICLMTVFFIPFALAFLL